VDVPGPKCRWRADWKRRRHPNRQDRLDAIKQCGTSPDRTCVSSSGDLVGQGVGHRSRSAWGGAGFILVPHNKARWTTSWSGSQRPTIRTTWCRSMTLRTLTCLRLAPASGHSNTMNPNLRASARRGSKVCLVAVRPGGERAGLRGLRPVQAMGSWVNGRPRTASSTWRPGPAPGAALVEVTPECPDDELRRSTHGPLSRDYALMLASLFGMTSSLVGPRSKVMPGRHE
jgi:hypothetical protein